MQGYILCCGTGDKLTSPAPHAINYAGRHYAFPPPGKCFRYVMLEHKPVITDLDAPYGLVIVEDLLERELVPSPVPVDMADEKRFSDTLITGQDRAKAIASSWAGKFPSPNYGAMYIENPPVTETQIAECRKARAAYATARLAGAIKEVRAGAHGKGRLDYCDAEHAWAKEMGKLLPTAAELLNDIPKREAARFTEPELEDDRVPCPKCGEDIKGQAVVCRYCSAKFKMPVAELLAQPEEVEAKA